MRLPDPTRDLSTRRPPLTTSWSVYVGTLSARKQRRLVEPLARRGQRLLKEMVSKVRGPEALHSSVVVLGPARAARSRLIEGNVSSSLKTAFAPSVGSVLMWFLGGSSGRAFTSASVDFDSTSCRLAGDPSPHVE